MGYEVVGATMKLWENKKQVEGGCLSTSAIDDAKKVCEILEIQHYTIECQENFKEHVINDFVCSYENCRTPNPCIECNRYLKFGAFYKKAIELECDYVATGHYAKIEYIEE